MVSMGSNNRVHSNMQMIPGKNWLAATLIKDSTVVVRRSAAFQDGEFDKRKPRPREKTWKDQFWERRQKQNGDPSQNEAAAHKVADNAETLSH